MVQAEAGARSEFLSVGGRIHLSIGVLTKYAVGVTDGTEGSLLAQRLTTVSKAAGETEKLQGDDCLSSGRPTGAAASENLCLLLRHPTGCASACAHASSRDWLPCLPQWERRCANSMHSSWEGWVLGKLQSGVSQELSSGKEGLEGCQRVWLRVSTGTWHPGQTVFSFSLIS